MTNEEIWQRQQEHRAHMAAVPGAVGAAKTALAIVPPGEGQVITLASATLAVLVAEIERLQKALRQANQDLRDEQREAQHAASAAYSEGRHEGLQEGRGW